ncbi:MAG: prenyltransferase [Oscillospiraceae bacterium]|nr:prenyltransferase [Oscillospiraceae bacterium]
MNKMNRKKTDRGLTLKAALQLSAPHTWPASVLPVLLGAALAFEKGAAPGPVRLLLTLATGVLLQSAVNTLNDYRDFSTGLDTAENCDDPTDAALIYEGAGPRAVLIFGLCLLMCAGAAGAALVIYLKSPVLLIYAGAALLAIMLYTMPGVSFSSLPLGEMLSGVAMGGVLTCAAYHIQSGGLKLEIPALCIPAVLTVAGIMLTNNISDTEKDREGNRRTFPVCVGRDAAQTVLRILIAVAALAVAIAASVKYPGGLAVVPVMFIAVALCSGPLFCRSLVREIRGLSMRCILASHSRIITSYIAVIILHRLTYI